MKLNQVPNFRVEDFQSEQSWIGRLFVQLNPFIQSVNQVLDRSIDYSTNIKSVTRDYNISGFAEFSFSWLYPEAAPVDLRVTKAFKGASFTPTLLLAVWEHDASNQLITISRMVEVNAATVSELSGRYQFTIRATV